MTIVDHDSLEREQRVAGCEAVMQRGLPGQTMRRFIELVGCLFWAYASGPSISFAQTTVPADCMGNGALEGQLW